MSRIASVLAVALMLSLSGCATISVTAEVGDKNTVERYNLNITTSTTVYGFLNEAAKDDGYDGIREMILSGEDVPKEKVEYSERIEGDTAYMDIKLSNLNPENSSSISITKSDGHLVYEDMTWVNESAEETSEMGESMMAGLVLKYKLIMPGKITDSNADSAEGNEATWRATGPNAMTDTMIRAESKTPTLIPGPGFDIVTALTAFLISGSVLFWRVADTS